jgi:AcrR family transcriptional regulator
MTRRSSEPAPPRPPRADAVRNRARLLETAAELFAREGTTVPLEEVARRAGVGIGTLYRHFPTREAVIEALMRTGLDGLLAQGQRLLRAPDAREALVTWLHAALCNTRAYRGLAGPMASACAATGPPQLHDGCARVQEATAALLRRAQRSGGIRADVTATDLVALINAIAWSGEQAPADAELPERLLGVVLQGLRRDPG